MRNSLADALDTITNTISGAQGALYNITSYRESRRRYYADGLTHKDIKDLKITKDQLFSLFRDPSTGLVPPTSRAHISIDWCVEPNIKANWMDRWYMVFDEDPHGNRDIPFYFLRKLYAEFILGKHVNYFDILGNQGVGHGMPQDREGARRDPNRVPRPPRTPKPPRLYPPAGPVIDYTQEALLDMAETLLEHATDVQGNVDQGAGTSTTSPSTEHRGDAESSQRRVTPHPCTSCGGICYGPASDFRDDGLLRFVSKSQYFNIIFCLMSKSSIVSSTLFIFNYLTTFVKKYVQLVSHGTPQSHSPSINVENIDAAVNIAFGFGSSPIGVIVLYLLICQFYLYLFITYRL